MLKLQRLRCSAPKFSCFLAIQRDRVPFPIAIGIVVKTTLPRTRRCKTPKPFSISNSGYYNFICSYNLSQSDRSREVMGFFSKLEPSIILCKAIPSPKKINSCAICSSDIGDLISPLSRAFFIDVFQMSNSCCKSPAIFSLNSGNSFKASKMSEK